MPLRIKPDDLKTAARVATLVKEVSRTADRRYVWNGLHRIVASGNRLELNTTDGSLFLQWPIAVEGGAEPDFDITVNASQFNDISLSALAGAICEISQSAGVLELRQSRRLIRLPRETSADYPVPQAPDADHVRTWRTGAEPLANTLEFIAPFVDAINPRADRSVATWRTDGTLIAGSPRAVAQVAGLGIPPVPLSFKHKVAKSVAAFLRHVSEAVEIKVSEQAYSFTDIRSQQQLMVPREHQMFPMTLHEFIECGHEAFLVDRESIYAGVSVLSILLTAGADRIDCRLKGRDDHASIRLSTTGQDSRNSYDECDILRTFSDFGGDTADTAATADRQVQETHFAVSAGRFRSVLGQLERVTLRVRVFPQRGHLYLEDVPTGDNVPTRSVLITVKMIEQGEIVQDAGLSEQVSEPTQHAGGQVNDTPIGEMYRSGCDESEDAILIGTEP